MKSFTFPFFMSAALAVLAGFSGCGKPGAATAPVAPPTLVELAPVVYSNVAVPVRVTGVLSRKTEADLSFKIGGVIEAVLVRAGDRVAKDQVLARLQLDEFDAQLTQARSALDKAQRDLGRVEKLQANAVATLENLQDARTTVELAAAQVRIAEFNRRYAVIAAPAAGRILRRVAEPNELITSGHAVLGFAADEDGWLVRAGLADKDLARLRIGDRAEVSLNDAGAAPLAGRIAHIAEAADPATRTTLVEIALDTAPAEARSGFVVETKLFPQPVAPRAVVPATVLIEGAGDTANIFVVEAGATVARRVAVEVEALDGATAYLRTALPRDARVVVRGGEYLHDGASVTVAGE